MPDFIKIIKELEAERDHLNEAIETSSRSITFH